MSTPARRVPARPPTRFGPPRRIRTSAGRHRAGVSAGSGDSHRARAKPLPTSDNVARRAPTQLARGANATARTAATAAWLAPADVRIRHREAIALNAIALIRRARDAIAPFRGA